MAIDLPRYEQPYPALNRNPRRKDHCESYREVLSEQVNPMMRSFFPCTGAGMSHNDIRHINAAGRLIIQSWFDEREEKKRRTNSRHDDEEFFSSPEKFTPFFLTNKTRPVTKVDKSKKLLESSKYSKI
ncbi:hypothetical protein TNCV_993881 [Trichonephila clavipes]|nr:hypothetical protein TNCV_993881 [Trichonephila clavipes]